MNTEREAILEALDKWTRQRSGMDPRNYGDWRSYRSEQRGITRDLQDFRTLLAAVRWREGIDAAALREAFRAFSGRLTLNDASARYDDGSVYPVFTLSYCTGQYFPTEYRKAACAVLASALWDYTRDKAMPAFDAGSAPSNPQGWSDGPLYDGISAGAWLRRYFWREFGPGIASRWFS